MSGRSRQTMVLPLLILAISFLAWGCGGGDVDTTSTSRPVATTEPAGSGAGADALVGTIPKTTADTPTEYVQAVDQGRPVVVLFYVPGGVDDAKVLENVTKLQAGFADYVFLLYDYKAPDAYGDLSTLLKVNYPPELVLVAGNGTIREIWNGYVDEGTLNQGMVNLGQ